MCCQHKPALLALLVLVLGQSCLASPLHDAAIDSDVITVKRLIASKQYDVNGLNEAGQTPLAAAFSTCSNSTGRFPKFVPDAQLGYCEPQLGFGSAAALICAGADVNVDVFPKARPGYTLLHHASCHSPLLVPLLLAAGAKVNAEYKVPETSQTLTPLAWNQACVAKNLTEEEYDAPRKATEYLVFFGARLDPTNPSKGSFSVPQLKDAGWGTWSKHLTAIRNGSWDGLDWVCGEVEEQHDMGAEEAAEKEADASYARNFPLHVAVTENNLPVIRSLIEGGKAKPDELDDKGRTPLQVGMNCWPSGWKRCTPRIKGRVAQYLISKGANASQDMGRPYVRGFTVLHRAASLALTPLVEALLAGGADPNAVYLDREDNKTLVTPLMRAADCDYGLSTYETDAFKALLDAGAQPYTPSTHQPITELFYDGGVQDKALLKRCSGVGGGCSEEEVAKLADDFDRCGGGWAEVWKALNKPKAGGAGSSNSTAGSKPAAPSAAGRKLLRWAL